MKARNLSFPALVMLLAALLALSCAKKAPKQEAAPPADTTKAKVGQYVSEEINFGIYFDEAGTKRTIKLDKGQKEITAYLIVNFPEGMKIAAVEYLISLPTGLAIDTDSPYEGIVAHIGKFTEGMSETFPCASGPRIIFHKFALKVTGPLSNAEIKILPDPQAKFLGVAICEPNNPTIPASSFKAVVNPTE
jgi:hypothetical protein